MKFVLHTARTLTLLLSCSVLGLMPATVWAQTDTKPKSAIKGITLSPPLKEVVLGPGLLEAKTTITLTNTTDKDMYATLRLVDFEASNEFGDISFSAVGSVGTKYALAQWMSLPLGNSVVIASGKSVNIPVHIDNSKDLSPGGHYGAVIASITSSSVPAAPNTVTLKQEVVSLLFIKKTGGESYGLELESLKSNGGNDFPYEVDLKFKNTGNVHVIPRGYVEITNNKGKLVSKGIINPESTIVLPDGSRQFITIMQPVANPGRAGKYTITAYYRYDGQNKFSTRSIYYEKKLLSTSQTILLTGVVAAAIIIVFAAVVRRRNGTRKVRQ